MTGGASSMMSLLIVDDEPLIRKGILERIDMAAMGIEAIWEAADGLNALKLAKDHQPDMMLADINMPGMDGLQLAKAVKEESPGTHIAIITGYDYFEYAVTALKTGVDDFVLKPVSRKDIHEILTKLIASVKADRQRKEAFSTAFQLTRDESAQNRNNEYAVAISRVLDRELSNPAFSLVQLAQEVALSQTYLSTLFRQIFGIPFQDWMIRARIDRAKILLLSTNLKVYEVAAKVGFDDPNYFSTAFKKQVKQTPNQYRDAQGANA